MPTLAERSLIWPGAAPGCTPSLGMSLCGLGLLSDNLGKILGRTRGSALWRPRHPQKLDLAPRHLLPRPGAAERPGHPSPRSVGGSVGAGVKEGSSSVGGWASDGSGWRLEGMGLSSGIPPALRPGPPWREEVVNSQLNPQLVLGN